MKKKFPLLVLLLFLSLSLAASAEEAKKSGFSFFGFRTSKPKGVPTDPLKKTAESTPAEPKTEEDEPAKPAETADTNGEPGKKEPVVLPASAAVAAPKTPVTVFKPPVTGPPKNPNSLIPTIPKPPQPPGVPNTSGPAAPPKAPNTKTT